jgi:hypothetical protein
MDDQDLLIQRFLDQDLAPEERVRFLETVVAEAGRLPRIAPSSQFTARVLAKLDAQPKGFFSRLAELFTVPRTLEWNLTGALATACVVVVAVIGLLRFAPERIVEVPVPMAGSQAQTASFTPVQEPKVFVRLVLLQPGAQSVSVAGDFNGWNPNQTKLEPSEGGMWTATIALKPGRYQYMFVIDGKQWIADPFAVDGAGDGFGSQNAVLDVSI